MKISCICCTYLRSHLLGQVIKCFERQEFPLADRELVILDDAGEYRPQRGPGWQLVSIDRRFRTLGEKRNAATALASSDADVFCVWDDDDLYLPHALSATARALTDAVEHRLPAISRPSQVLYEDAEGFRRHQTGGLYQGGWAYTRWAFYKVGGYNPHDNGEDQEFLGRLQTAGVETVDPITNSSPPFYVFREANNSYHVSWGPTYTDLGKRKHDGFKETLSVAWPYDLKARPILERVHPRPF